MKHKRTSPILIAALATGFALSSSASEDGLVAHFTFDDAEHWGYDSVRQAEIGTVSNTVVSGYSEPLASPSSCEAPVVRGMQFASGWWQNNYMEVPGALFGSAHGIPYGSQAVTYSLWIKPSPGWQTWNTQGIGTLSYLLRHGSPGYEWYGNPASGEPLSHENIYIRRDGTTGTPKIAFGVGVYDASETSAIYEAPGLFDGNWHFIAATHTNRTLALYYDGLKVAETVLTVDITMGDDRPLLIGDPCTTGDEYLMKRYAGCVDDIKVYNRALGAAEVLAAFNAVHDAAIAASVPLTADASVGNFPRLAGETDDAPRVQRAIDATAGGILYLPRGDYQIASTLVVTNRCSLMMHKSATLKAVSQMDYVLRVGNGGAEPYLGFLCFIRGGAIDGNGLASCLSFDGYARQSFEDIKFFNGKQYGLHVGSASPDVIAKGLYFLCRKHGLAGNTAMLLQGDGGHYTDIHILDWTTGAVVTGRSNRLTRFHAWGGSLSPAIPGDIPEMLPGSTSFRIEGDSTILRDCYADTSQTGFDIRGAVDVRILGCSYYNNRDYGLNDLTILRQTGGSEALLVANCVFTRSGTSERINVYDGNGLVTWRDIIYGGDWSGVERPGRD